MGLLAFAAARFSPALRPILTLSISEKSVLEQLVRHGGYVDRILKGEKNTASPSSPLVTPGITSGHPGA
jgi:hypothetical protein